MEIRSTILQLADTVGPDQRERLEAQLPAEAWKAFRRLEDKAREDPDEDEVKLALVQFGMAIPEPEVFRSALSPEQQGLVEQIEDALRTELGM